jgi:hypothetical protein
MSANLLREWIASVVKDELTATFETFEGVYSPGQEIQKHHRRCRPDATEAHLQKKRLVRIIDVVFIYLFIELD